MDIKKRRDLLYGILNSWVVAGILEWCDADNTEFTNNRPQELYDDMMEIFEDIGVCDEYGHVRREVRSTEAMRDLILALRDELVPDSD